MCLQACVCSSFSKQYYETTEWAGSPSRGNGYELGSCCVRAYFINGWSNGQRWWFCASKANYSHQRAGQSGVDTWVNQVPIEEPLAGCLLAKVESYTLPTGTQARRGRTRSRKHSYLLGALFGFTSITFALRPEPADGKVIGWTKLSVNAHYGHCLQFSPCGRFLVFVERTARQMR